MDKRKILELAAKAAGIRHIEYTNDYDGQYGLVMCDEIGRHGDTWNPLDDDGDCARLETSCQIDIQWFEEDGEVCAILHGWHFVGVKFSVHNGDKNKARRYASTQVAAMFAENIKKG